uniref:Uncharacterized protein n=1 Tax=Wuchereria bancrofti TaxID=6293 RepID=A0AAF5PWV3_WUCBA
MSGIEMQFCKNYFTDEFFAAAACFCRTYDNSAPACNNDPKMVSMATRILVSEGANHYSRFVFRHVLNTAGNLWCFSSPFYAKIYFDR